MGISNLLVSFDKTSGVFFAGGTLSGIVKFDVAKSTKLVGISVKYIGKAEVHWTETKQDGTEHKTKHYRSNETYFAKRVRIYDVPDNIIKPKRYSIPFKFKLDKELPSSFVGKHGKVNYFLKVIFVRPQKHDNVVKKNLPFSVVGLKNLNRLPLLQKPIKLSVAKTFGVLAWKSKPVSARLTMNKQAFVPGENILLSGIIDNESDVKITDCELRIRKKEVYRAGGHTEKVVSTVFKVRQPGVAKQTKAVWENVKVKVPCLPPSGLDGCSIIDVSYTLEVKIVPSGAHFSLSLSFKITIGTIPFKKVNGPALTSGGDKNKKSVVTTRKSQKCASTQASFKEPGPASNTSSGIILPTPEPLGVPAPNAKMTPPSSEGSSMTPPYPIENQSLIPQYQLQANYNNDGVLAYPTAPPSEFSDLGIDLDDGMYQSDLQPTFGEYCWGGDEAPPSYESLFKGGEGEDDDDISRNYVPKYPSYNIQPSAPPKDDDRE